MAKQTKTLKQDGEPEIEIYYENGLIHLWQDSDCILIGEKSLPELIELLKSELEVNNG